MPASNLLFDCINGKKLAFFYQYKILKAAVIEYVLIFFNVSTPASQAAVAQCVRRKNRECEPPIVYLLYLLYSRRN